MCEAVERLVESRRPEWEKVGEKKKAKAVAKKMLERGMGYDEIALISDLSIDEIKQIDAGRKS